MRMSTVAVWERRASPWGARRPSMPSMTLAPTAQVMASADQALTLSLSV